MSEQMNFPNLTSEYEFEIPTNESNDYIDLISHDFTASVSEETNYNRVIVAESMEISDKSDCGSGNGTISSENLDIQEERNEPVDSEIIAKMTENFRCKQNQVNDKAMKFLEKMEYPKIFIGPILPSQMKPNDWRLIKKGKMTPEEKDLFLFANRILQYPSSLLRAETIRTTSKQNYSYYIARYLTFMAKNKVSVEEFTIDGVFMQEAMVEYIEKREKEGKSGDAVKAMEAFQHGIKFFNHCLALYKCRDITDKREQLSKVEELKEIPNLSYLVEFIRRRRHSHHEIARENFHNKHRDEYTNEVYTIDNLKAMMVNMYNLTGQGGGIKKNIFNGINAILELLLGHHLLYRGDNKRSCELSDITWNEHNTSRGKVPILGFTTNRSKTISGGDKPHSMGACRNKDVEICLVTAVSMSLWYRFNFEDHHGPLVGKDRPDFLDKKNWYPVKLLFADSANSRRNEAISYNHESQLVKMCLKTIDAFMTKVTHLGRKVAACIADAFDVEMAQISRAGNWKDSILSGAYLTTYPFDFIFMSGGYEEGEPYICYRDIKPPQSLEAKIFPWLDKALEDVKNRDIEKGWLLNNRKDFERDTAAAKFLSMLVKFRRIIIQDLTKLVDQAPESIFAQHPITKDVEFLRFKEKVTRAEEELGLCDDIQEKRALANILAPSFSKKVESMKFAISKLYSTMVREFDGVKQEFNEVKSTREDLILRVFQEREGKIIEEIKASVGDQLWEVINDRYLNEDAKDYCFKSTLETNEKRLTSLEKSMTHMEKSMNSLEERFHEGFDSTLEKLTRLNDSVLQSTHMSAVVCDKVAGPSAKLISPVITQNAGQIEGSGSGTPEPAARAITSLETALEVPVYAGNSVLQRAVPSLKMRSDSTTVMKLLDEWYVSKPGIPSVEKRNELYGYSWRGASSTYKRRKAIIKYIDSHVISSETFPDATRLQLGKTMDVYRTNHGLTMNALSGKCQNSREKDEMTKELAEIWANEIDKAGGAGGEI